MADPGGKYGQDSTLRILRGTIGYQGHHRPVRCTTGLEQKLEHRFITTPVIKIIVFVMVEVELTANRRSKHDFPTPESPIRSSLNR